MADCGDDHRSPLRLPCRLFIAIELSVLPVGEPGGNGLLQAGRISGIRQRTGNSARLGTAFAVSGAVHLLAGLALTAVVWSSAPEAPLPATVSVVFETPAQQQATAAPDVAPATTSEPEPPQQQPTERADAAPVVPLPEPAPEPPQAEPPQPEQAVAALPDHAEALPAVPVPEPEPAPIPETPVPPPPVTQALPLPPPPVQYSKPPAKQLVARPQVAPQSRPAAKPVPSVAEAPVAASAPPVARADPQMIANWNALFSAWLAARKTYPEVARRRGEQGNVTLRFRVGVDGTVLDVALVTGSGSPLLDDAARALLRNAKLPPPQTEIVREVRVRYRLDD